MSEAEAEGREENSERDSERDIDSPETLEEKVGAEPDSDTKQGSRESPERKVIYGKFGSKHAKPKSSSKERDSDNNYSNDDNAVYGKFEDSKDISHAVHSGAARQPGKKVQKYAVAIIYHKDEYTGKRMYVLEENPPDYGTGIETLKEERGKLRPLGGTGEDHDKTTKQTVVREFQEEVSKPGSEILANNFESHGKYLTTISTSHPGEISETDVFLLEIPDRNEWKSFIESKWGHDAGYQRIYTDSELMTMPNESFAYVYGPLIKRVVGGHSSRIGASNHLIASSATPMQKSILPLNLESAVNSLAYKTPEPMFYKTAA